MKKNKIPRKKPEPKEALCGALGLCYKAGKLTLGFDATVEACMKGKVWIVLVAEDTSEKTLRRLKQSVEDLVEIHTIPLNQNDLLMISRKPVSIYAVTDQNFAQLCLSKLENNDAISMKEEITE